MANRRWLEELREQFSHHALPPSYIERLVEELSDHFNDIMEESMGKEAEDARGAADRLGVPSDLARAAAAGYLKRSFCLKHPLLTFIVLPVPLLVILSCVSLLVGFGIGRAVGLLPGESRTAITAFLMCWTPLFISAVIFCRMVQLSGQRWQWALCACSVLTVPVGLDALLSLGFHTSVFHARDCVLAVTPLATAGAFVGWHAIRRQRRLGMG